VVVDDLDIQGVAVQKAEAQPPLGIDPNAPLSGAITLNPSGQDGLTT
jgi:hypothetical protein